MATLLKLLVFQFCLMPTFQGLWWSLGNMHPKDLEMIPVAYLDKLTHRQRSIVKKEMGLMDAIAKGSAMSIRECKRQFGRRKWNCSNYSSETVFGKILNRACRETAFIHAITAAAVTFTLTENCNRGSINGCPCKPFDYCYHWGKIFVDAKETSSDFKSMVNLHNNEAGRLAVKDGMKKICKCHGVSGSCNSMTCRMTLPHFGDIGAMLKERYDTASRVKTIQIPGNRRITRDHFQHHRLYEIKYPRPEELIYFEDSPDFCEKNISDGSLGTHGRQCNSSLRAKGVDGCEILCCGRDWITENLTKIENCKCKFVWCCEVICQKCSVTNEYSFCK